MQGKTAGKAVFSIVIALLAVAHVSHAITIDAAGMALIGLAMVPWASSWLESIRVGDFEAKFRALQQTVDATKKELDEIKATYQVMQDDYLDDCKAFDPDAPAAELNRLATRLKAKAKGLASIDFLFADLAQTGDQGLAFGAACALQVRPQFQAIDGVVRLLDALAQTPDLRGFRLKTIYRLLMAVDEIVKLDARNGRTLLSDAQRGALAAALQQLARHARCVGDDTEDYAQRIGGKL